MAEKTEIAWTDSTFNPWLSVMVLVVAFVAQRNSVVHVESKLGMIRKWPDVMCAKVSAARIAAMLAGKFVPQEHVKAPSLVIHGKSLVPAVCEFAVFVGMAPLAPMRSFSRLLAYQCAGIKGMFLSGPVAATPLCRLAHLFP